MPPETLRDVRVYPLWQGLLANLSAVALCLAIWTHSLGRLRQMRHTARSLITGAIVGLGMVSTMLLSFEVQPGVHFDLRGALMVNVALFGGPLAAGIAFAMGAVFRIVIGGGGVVAGLVSMALAFGIGASLRLAWRRRHRIGRLQALLASLLVAYSSGFVIFGHGLAQPMMMDGNIWHLIVPMASMMFLATLLAAFGLILAFDAADSANVLNAALSQASDYHYVKDANGRFLAVNDKVARHHGYAKPADMVGLSDADLYPPERAAELAAQEAEVLEQGRTLSGIEEQIVEADGAPHWYETSKTPLRDRDGNIVGLAGLTRDITERKQLYLALRDSRDMIAHALAEMSDGLALFDQEGRLRLCNEQYRALFPLTGHMRRPGVTLREILAAAVATEEEMLPEGAEAKAWIDETVKNLHRDTTEQIELYDGRTLTIRTRPTAQGDTLVLVSDVTEMRRGQQAMQQLNAELSRLATTDALTRLANRRAFDTALEQETQRASRNGTTLSLLMIDVDFFKAYNDRYGHVAGDACLARVAGCLQVLLRRPADIAARYGGEEFALVLPETDAVGAAHLAAAALDKVRSLEIEHRGSPLGRITVSVGFASCDGSACRQSGGELIARADAALYSAKSSGRNRAVEGIDFERKDVGVA
jgi:diguanylate cyclase (GGDEF)-like protein/PAS domain S-box-containing protein